MSIRPGGVELAALAGQVVEPVLVELGGRHIEPQVDVAAGLEPGLVDGLEDDLDGRLVGGQVGGEAALVAHRGGHALGRQHGLQGMEDLGPVAHRLAQGLGPHRQDHELLEVDAVGGMGPAVDDVHHRHRQAVVAVTQVLVQGHGALLGRRVGGGERDPEQGVGAQSLLIFGAVQGDHLVIDGGLLADLHAHQGAAQFAADVGHGLEDTLAAIAGLVPVAQFQGLAGPGGGARGDRRPAQGPIGGDDIGLDGGVTAGIEDLTGADIDDLGHGVFSGWVANERVCGPEMELQMNANGKYALLAVAPGRADLRRRATCFNSAP